MATNNEFWSSIVYVGTFGALGCFILAEIASVDDFADLCNKTLIQTSTVFITEAIGAVLGALSSEYAYQSQIAQNHLVLAASLIATGGISGAIAFNISFVGLHRMFGLGGFFFGFATIGTQYLLIKVHGKNAGSWLYASQFALPFCGGLIILCAEALELQLTALFVLIGFILIFCALLIIVVFAVLESERRRKIADKTSQQDIHSINSQKSNQSGSRNSSNKSKNKEDVETSSKSKLSSTTSNREETVDEDEVENNNDQNHSVFHSLAQVLGSSSSSSSLSSTSSVLSSLLFVVHHIIIQKSSFL
jgi:hypothetical protein